MEIEKPVSFREFARMTGTSDGAVRKAIARESIKDGLVDEGGKKMILPSVASAEWGKAILTAEPDSKDATDEGALAQNSNISSVPTGAISLVGAGGPVVAPGAELAGAAAADASDEADEAVSEAELIAPIEEHITKVKAERLIAVYKARKAQAEYLETIGDLIRKGIVYDRLFEYGTEIRQNLMNVPSRCAAMVRAANTDREGELIMEKEIHSALVVLADTSTVKLTK